MHILTELPYLPPIAWCAMAWNAESVTLEACEHYQKGTYRNRCHIASPNGPQRLSIPLLQGKHQQTPIREVKISYAEPWQQVHWRSIMAAYGRSPYFEHYAGDLMPFYQKKYEFLFDFNLNLLQMVLKKMDFKGNFNFSETWQEKHVSTMQDCRDVISPKSEKIPEWIITKKYPQVFEEKHGFLENLSVLDLLFCCGKNGREVLGV